METVRTGYTHLHFHTHNFTHTHKAMRISYLLFAKDEVEEDDKKNQDRLGKVVSIITCVHGNWKYENTRNCLWLIRWNL